MADVKDGPELHPVTVELAEGANFGSITTVFPSGLFQTHVIWVGTDDGRLVVNTEVHRKKYTNTQTDPRITLTIRDEGDPYRYAEVRGRVEETVAGQKARDHIDEVARKYTGGDYPPDNIKTERVIMYIAPERQTIVHQSEGVGTED